MTEVLSDEVLTAYLDGALPEAERRQVEAALADDALAQNRLKALELPQAEIKAAFDDLLAAAPDAPNLPPVEQTRRHRAAWGLAAALVLGAMLGASWPLFSRPAPSSDWKMDVAQYQALYVPQTLAQPAASHQANSTKLADLSQALGHDLAQALTAKGLDFRRAQMLGRNGQPLVQIAYVAPDGTPIALCVTPVDEADYDLRSESLVGLAASHWAQGGFGFVVIGGTDQGFVTKIARDLQGRI